MKEEKPNVIEQYIKDHEPRIDMARGKDVTVVHVVLVDGVPVQTPKWMVDIMEKIMEKMKESDGELVKTHYYPLPTSDGMNVSQVVVDEWMGE